MCGIACIVDKRNMFDIKDFDNFVDTVAHRGPDSRGSIFFSNLTVNKEYQETDSDNFNLALGHRRLSILDLSDAGKQPMYSPNKDILIVYNGEIYNFIEIKQELAAEGFSFSSDCDTEVIIAAYIHWGKECVKHFNGMWSFVIFDKKKKTLFISRDRLGIKPLYYSYPVRDILLIASEIKQILSLPRISCEPNDNVCISYLLSGHENFSETFFQNIYPFPPGHYAEISLATLDFKPQSYWSPYNIELDNSKKISDIIPRIRELFKNAVNLRLRSDVPVGGCLSGGLDSSSIFCMMSRLYPDRKSAAFSSCFDNCAVDERPFMKEVIKNTGSEHFTVFPQPENLAAEFESFIRTHDEPVGSISVYAQNKIMEKAKDVNVTVLLDGQGGDEIFSGYWVAYLQLLNYYLKNKNFLKLSHHTLFSCMPGGNSELLRNAISHYTLYRKRNAAILPFAIKNEFTDTDMSQWHKELLALTPIEYRIKELTEVYLPRYLKWEDRNSMSHSRESRVPFLDINLISFVLSVHPEMNMRKGWNKYLFRLAMNGLLPEKICWRRDKLGFETPQYQWLTEGAFFNYLIHWLKEAEHPVSKYISTDFSALLNNFTKNNKNMDSLAFFRLLCLDKWMQIYFS